MAKRPELESVENPASPACGMHEACDAYMGYAENDEIVAFLNEMLEAERAGARVCLESARQNETTSYTDALHAIHRDEAQWCAMLAEALTERGAAPSSHIGAFYEKAMAFDDIGARAAFLNRGQGWVVRKLKEMLPRIRDDRLHGKLRDMLHAHEINIARIEHILR